MMNMISGALTPDFGKIIIDGKNVTKLPEYKRSQYNRTSISRSDGWNSTNDDD